MFYLTRGDCALTFHSFLPSLPPTPAEPGTIPATPDKKVGTVWSWLSAGMPAFEEAKLSCFLPGPRLDDLVLAGCCSEGDRGRVSPSSVKECLPGNHRGL